MKKLVGGSFFGIVLCCMAAACGVGDKEPYAALESDSIYYLPKILKISYQQPEVAIERLDSCEKKGLNSVDSICFYRGTLYGLLKRTDLMFAEWEKILFREGADVGSDLYLHVLRTEASMKNNRNQKVKALEYCLLGDSLATAHNNSFSSIQFKVLAADISNECFVQKENITILEKCVEDSKSFLDEKRTFNTHLFIREDLYDAYCRYNPFAGEEDKKDDAFLYQYLCESKELIDQMVEKFHDGVSNESLNYKYIQYYGHMVEHLVKMGRKEEARAIFEQKAKPLCMGASRILRTANNVAMMQSFLGDLDPSIDYYRQALAQSEAKHDSVSMMIDLNILRDCYEQKGDYQNAYQTLTQYHDLYKHNARKDLLGQSAEYLTLFKVQEHEMAQREAEAEAQISKVVATVVSIVLVVVFCLLVLLWRQYHTIKQMNRALVANINEVLDARQKEQAMMEPVEAPVNENTECLTESEAPGGKTANEVDSHRVQYYIYQLTSRKLFCAVDFDREALLDELHLPKSGFWKVFSEVTGQNFAPYLLNLRLEYAADQIRQHPEFTVDSIAIESGFSSRSTFYRNFTTRFGISPKVYRGELENE